MDFLPVRPCHEEGHGHGHRHKQTQTDRDTLTVILGEGKCCGSKDCLLVRIWPSASRMWTFQWMVPFPWVIWTTQIGLWGLLKASRGYKVGRGESEEGDYREKWGISTIKIHFMKLAKN